MKCPKKDKKIYIDPGKSSQKEWKKNKHVEEERKFPNTSGEDEGRPEEGSSAFVVNGLDTYRPTATKVGSALSVRRITLATIVPIPEEAENLLSVRISTDNAVQVAPDKSAQKMQIYRFTKKMYYIS